MPKERKKRLTKQQREALDRYLFAERQEEGQAEYEANRIAAYEACKRLGMDMEHGL